MDALRCMGGAVFECQRTLRPKRALEGSSTIASPNEDYYGWTQETAEKLRQGRLNEVNMADLIEEIEDRG